MFSNNSLYRFCVMNHFDYPSEDTVCCVPTLDTRNRIIDAAPCLTNSRNLLQNKCSHAWKLLTTQSSPENYVCQICVHAYVQNLSSNLLCIHHCDQVIFTFFSIHSSPRSTCVCSVKQAHIFVYTYKYRDNQDVPTHNIFPDALGTRP